MITRRHLLTLLSVAIICLSGLTTTVFAFNGGAKVAIDPRIIDVEVCNDFTVTLSITDLPGVMNKIDLYITWDTSLMKYKSHTFLAPEPGWTDAGSFVDPDAGSFHFVAGGPPTSDSNDWVEITFHCEGPGSSPINLVDVRLLLDDFDLLIEQTLKGAVNQYELAPVGGISTPINKLEILAPYIALVGLVAVVSTVYVIKRRKN